MSKPRRRSFATGFVAMALAWAFAIPARANVKHGDLELGVRVEMPHTFQSDSTDDVEWAQWRNELRLEGVYDVLPYGESYGPLEAAKFSLLWRLRADPVFAIRDRYRRHGLERDDFLFPEGKTPREAYLDLDFRGVLDTPGRSSASARTTPTSSTSSTSSP